MRFSLIFRNIKRSVVKRRIRKNLKKGVQREFLSFSQIKNCLLTYCIDNDKDLSKIIRLEEWMKASNIDATIYCYVHRKSTVIEQTTKRIVFARKQLSFLGRPQEDIMKPLQTMEFDVVFDLTRKSYIPVLYILMEAKAILYCSTDMRKELGFNFVLNTEKSDNTDDIFVLDQFRYYLNKINNNLINNSVEC